MPSKMALVDTPAVWRGRDLDWRSETEHRFTDEGLQAIEAALRTFQALGSNDVADITPETFPLPVLADQLARIKTELNVGRGFVLLRGLSRERFSDDELAIVYVGLGVHLGRPTAQSHRGELLGSVVDVSDLVDNPRGYRAGGKQGVHTDGTACDIIGLMCLREAQSGGASRLVSAAAVNNYLIEERPDLAAALYEGYHLRMHGPDVEHSAGDGKSRGKAPVFMQEREFTCMLDGGNWLYAIKAGDTVATDIEIEASKALQRLALDERFYLDMMIREGDIQFINNRKIFHSRLDYDDEDELDRRRHMLRLWLQVPDWHPWPEEQVLYSHEDTRLWLARRKGSIELPSAYIAAMKEEQDVRRREDRILERTKPYNKY